MNEDMMSALKYIGEVQPKPKSDEQAIKATKGIVLAEASNDRLWGTGIPLRDRHALTQASWSLCGWLSDMLHEIRDK